MFVLGNKGQVHRGKEFFYVFQTTCKVQNLKNWKLKNEEIEFIFQNKEQNKNLARLCNIVFAYEILLENIRFHEITKRTVISKIGKVTESLRITQLLVLRKKIPKILIS